MKNKTKIKPVANPQRLINPEKLWAIENELIDIPLQYRDDFWNELLASYSQDLACNESSGIE